MLRDTASGRRKEWERWGDRIPRQSDNSIFLYGKSQVRELVGTVTTW